MFQNPFEAFNPRLTLGRSLAEPLVCARVPPVESERLISLALSRAGLAELRQLLDRRPNQVSGGQLQRAAVARAIVLEPALLIADEPVSMLDVSVRAGVLSALRAAQESLGFSAIYISHDLTLVRTVCRRTIVLFRGTVVEDGDTATVLRRPQHPYTKALIAAVPRPRVDQPRDPLPLVGSASDAAPSGGCRFRDRCPIAVARCADEAPAFTDMGSGHRVACHRVNS